jgi:signal peptidase II
MRWGLPLALGGAMGNLVDRIRYGQVIDFIDMYVTRGGREHHWPTYNVADIAIVAGVALMVIDMILPARRSAPRSDNGLTLATTPALAPATAAPALAAPLALEAGAPPAIGAAPAPPTLEIVPDEEGDAEFPEDAQPQNAADAPKADAP